MNNSSNNEKSAKAYLKVASLCAFITAFTTIAIHRIDVPSGNFEETVLLYKNSLFFLQNWIIMIHCLMVLLSMLGVALVIEKHSWALAILGFIFFLLFVFQSGKEH